MNLIDIFKGRLVFDPFSFSQEEIKRKTQAMKFTQPWVVESFLWNLELFGQIQRLAENQVLLKGGTAAQLYVPIGLQRSSVDLDLICLYTPERFKELLMEVERRLINDSVYFQFEPYVPEAPEVPLPLSTYHVVVPSTIGNTVQTPEGSIPGQRIKVDVLHLRIRSADFSRLSGVKTFAGELSYSPLCVAIGFLIGDKLLTLATKSVGVPEERHGDLQKHIYDLNNLTHLRLNDKAIGNVIHTINSLTPIEAGFRNLNVDPSDVLLDCIETLERFGNIDLKEGDPQIKREYNDFQSLYLSRNNYIPFYELATKGHRLKFIAKCLDSKIEGKISSAFVPIEAAARLEESIQFKGEDPEEASRKRRRISQVLLEEARQLVPGIWKELKGKPPERILWQLLTPDNWKDIREVIRG